MVVFWQHNESGSRLPAGLLKRTRVLLQRTVRLARFPFAELGVVYITPSVSRSLNRRYRRHDWVTDVLSFTHQTRPAVGELFICLAQAQTQARRAKVSLAAELDRLITHGLLHLAGHDHVRSQERKIMRALEDRILGL